MSATENDNNLIILDYNAGIAYIHSKRLYNPNNIPTEEAIEKYFEELGLNSTELEWMVCNEIHMTL
jgi:hypothetical protein